MSGLLATLGTFLGYAIPWWLWGAPAAVAVVLVLRAFGPRAAAVAAAGLALVLAHRKGAQGGFARAAKEGERDVSESLSAARSARDAAGRRDGDARRLRDDDGFRRD